MHEPAFKSCAFTSSLSAEAGGHRERSVLRQYPATLRPYLSSDLSAHDAGLGGAMTQLVKDFALFCCLVPSVSGIVITAATFLV
jgi:hypothetical protein